MNLKLQKKGLSFAIIVVSALLIVTCKKNSASPGSSTSKSKTFIVTSNTDVNGYISPLGANTVDSGASANYTITPNPGYGISSLTVDNVAIVPVVTSYSFVNVKANHTINVTFARLINVNVIVDNGTATFPSEQAVAGGTLTISIAPKAAFHTDTLWVNGVFAQALNKATSCTVTNIQPNETIYISCSDALSKMELDSLNNLLIGQWTMVKLNSKLGNLQDVVLPWDTQPSYACASNQFDQFYANGTFQRNNNPVACDPLVGQQFVPRSLNHWKLKKNGKVIYMTDPPLDSLSVITITKDSLITFFYGGYSPTQGISYRYHYARVP